MARGLTVLVALVLVLGGCSPTPEPATQLSEGDQIREAVFRYQFEFNASGLGQGAAVYFLSAEGRSDPSSELLQRFDGQSPPVKPVSRSTREQGTAQVVDAETGAPSLIFTITEIRRLGENAAEVDGGYDEASESGSGNTYRLTRQDGSWRVIERQRGWIK